MVKLRTMKGRESRDQMYTKESDQRITFIGFWLRRLKLDEVPQLLNIALGHMAFFGPRPDVPQAFSHYVGEEKRVFTVLPGLIDIASLVFSEEGKILASKQKGHTYEKIFRLKKDLACFYIDNSSVRMNASLFFLFFIRVVSNSLFVVGLEKFFLVFSVPKKFKEEALLYAAH